MSELGDEIAALRTSLTELRVGVARRWAARRGEPLRGALERSVRRAGLRVLGAGRPTHAPPAARDRPLDRRASGGVSSLPTARRALPRRAGTRRRAAGAALLVAALLWPLLVWLPLGAPTAGAQILLGLAAVCSGALGLRLLRKG